MCGSVFIKNSSDRSSGGPATETIRSAREESKSPPLEVLGVISPWIPLATLSFHKENSAIAEGLVLLGEGILESSERAVLCFCCRPSGAPDQELTRNFTYRKRILNVQRLRHGIMYFYKDEI